MKIIKYSKINIYEYKLTLEDNREITLSEDIILKNELLITKNIEEKELKRLEQENKKYESYYKSIKYISKKERTEKEITKYLSDYDIKDIKYTIDRLKKEGYISSNRYIDLYIKDNINLKLVGPNKIKKDLINLGLKEDDIDIKIKEIDKNTWLNKIDKIVSKSYQNNHKYSNNYLKNKIELDLINKGFYKSDIELILNEYNTNDNDILKKEIEKSKRILSNKYTGKELEEKLIRKLLTKGFQYNEIKKFL